MGSNSAADGSSPGLVATAIEPRAVIAISDALATSRQLHDSRPAAIGDPPPQGCDGEIPAAAAISRNERTRSPRDRSATLPPPHAEAWSAWSVGMDMWGTIVSARRGRRPLFTMVLVASTERGSKYGGLARNLHQFSPTPRDTIQRPRAAEI